MASPILADGPAARARSTRLQPAGRLYRQEARCLNRWIDCIGAAGPLLEQLGRRLSAALGQPLTLRFQSLRSERPAGVPAEQCVSFPLGLPEQASRSWIAIDADLGAALVDALLAGPGQAPGVVRPLTDLERGALSYLVLLVNRELERATGQRPRLLSLGRDGAEPLSEITPCLTLEAALARHCGQIRVYLPTDALPEPMARPGLSGDLAGPVLGSSLTARIEIGSGRLPLSEAAALAPDDVLFLDCLDVDPALQGRARLCCGAGRTALRCEIEPQADRIRLTVLGVEPAAMEIERVDMSDSSNSSMDEPTRTDSDQPLAGPLLDDVPVRVSLELGRLTLSARELLSLEVGHVLSTEAKPGDPLGIAVNGELVAEAELVEVEGRLGARLTRIVGR